VNDSGGLFQHKIEMIEIDAPADANDASLLDVESMVADLLRLVPILSAGMSYSATMSSVLRSYPTSL
jgi:hypothetical protein